MAVSPKPLQALAGNCRRTAVPTKNARNLDAVEVTVDHLWSVAEPHPPSSVRSGGLGRRQYKYGHVSHPLNVTRVSLFGGITMQHVRPYVTSGICAAHDIFVCESFPVVSRAM